MVRLGDFEADWPATEASFLPSHLNDAVPPGGFGAVRHARAVRRLCDGCRLLWVKGERGGPKKGG